MAKQRAKARRTGGRHTRRAGPVAVGTISDLQGLLADEMAAVRRLSPTTRRANAVARLVLVALRLIEIGEHEERIDAIERRLLAMEATK